MEYLSLLASVASLVLSIYAVRRANSVKKAVEKAEKDRDLQEDLVRVQQVKAIISEAKNSAKIWVQGAPKSSQRGLKSDKAVAEILDVEDALNSLGRTMLSSRMNDLVIEKVETLGALRESIVGEDSILDDWAIMVKELGDLSREFDQLERTLKNSQIAID